MWLESYSESGLANAGPLSSESYTDTDVVRSIGKPVRTFCSVPQKVVRKLVSGVIEECRSVVSPQRTDDCVSDAFARHTVERLIPDVAD